VRRYRGAVVDDLPRLIDASCPPVTCGNCGDTFTHGEFYGDRANSTMDDCRWCGRCKRAWWISVDEAARTCLNSRPLHHNPVCTPSQSCWGCAVYRRVRAFRTVAEGLDTPVWYEW